MEDRTWRSLNYEERLAIEERDLKFLMDLGMDVSSDPWIDDWTEVFGYANGRNHQYMDPNITSIGGVSSALFDPEDVKQIDVYSAGENDGDEWIVVGELRDGRWFFISAGCDYTGWDCQAGGNVWVAPTKEDIVAHAMGDEDRLRLYGMSLS